MKSSALAALCASALLLGLPAVGEARDSNAARIDLQPGERASASVQADGCNGARLIVMVANRSLPMARVRGHRWRRYRSAPTKVPLAGRARVRIRKRGCHDDLHVRRIDVLPDKHAQPPAEAAPDPAVPVTDPTPDDGVPPTTDPAPVPDPNPAPDPAPVSGAGGVPLGAAVGLPPMRTGGSAYARTFVDNFDSLTPENEMKMDSIATAQGQYYFASADQLVGFAQAHDKDVRGHTLVWGQQLPGWLVNGTWTRDQLIAYLKQYVKTVVGHFRGQVRDWDVINEPFADDGSLKDTFWLRGIGPGYIEIALRAARAADPDARLFINDYSNERLNAKSQGMYDFAKDLLARGVPLDGIGFQMHVKTTWHPTRAELDSNLARFAGLGLEVAITEMDVGTLETNADASTRDRLAAGIYRDAAGACSAQPACTSFTTWGVSDASTWIGTNERPLLFDAQFAAKPALDAVQGSLGR